MATLTVQDITTSGLEPDFSAADVAGDKFAWDRYRFLHVKNGGASPVTVDVVSQRGAVPGLAPANIEVTIPAGEERIIGPFDKDGFRKADGMVEVTYSGVTSVTVAAFNL